MRSPDWKSTAIFLSWDDWGGFYDHVVPPRVDQNGYGLRVPGIVISPYARRGFIDHQTSATTPTSSSSKTTFSAESASIRAPTAGPISAHRCAKRPDSRRSAQDFDFNQMPRQPEILPGGIDLERAVP